MAVIGSFKIISDEHNSYSIDTGDIEQELTELKDTVSENYANSAHMDVINFVTDMGADPTGSASADVIAGQIQPQLEIHYGVYIPDGMYNFTRFHVLTGNVFISDKCLNDNLFLLKTTPVNYSSNAFQLKKSAVKDFDQMSFQGGCEWNNSYYVGYRNDTTTQLS